jgi:hypothetical protein
MEPDALIAKFQESKYLSRAGAGIFAMVLCGFLVADKFDLSLSLTIGLILLIYVPLFAYGWVLENRVKNCALRIDGDGIHDYQSGQSAAWENVDEVRYRLRPNRELGVDFNYLEIKLKATQSTPAQRSITRRIMGSINKTMVDADIVIDLSNLDVPPDKILQSAKSFFERQRGTIAEEFSTGKDQAQGHQDDFSKA